MSLNTCKVITPKSDVDKMVEVSINGHSVEYNSAEFELLEDHKGFQYLHYTGKGGVVLNPKGNTSAYRMFDRRSDIGYKHLKPLEKPIDLSHFDSHFITDMRCMFYSFKNFVGMVKGIDALDTSNVENMSSMFGKANCRGLTLDLRNFNTSKVKDMSYMFQATFLADINVSSFNTSNVEDMSGMFEQTDVYCLDLRNFNTSKVEDMSFMFYGCIKLGKLDLSSFDISNVLYMFEMFKGSFCKNAEPLDLTSFYVPLYCQSFVKDILENCNASCVLVNSVMYSAFLKYRGNYKNEIIVRDVNLNLLDMISSVGHLSEEDKFDKMKSEGYLNKDILPAMYALDSRSNVVIEYCDKFIIPKLSKDLMSGDKTVGDVLNIYYGKYPKVLVNEAMCRLLRNHNIV